MIYVEPVNLFIYTGSFLPEIEQQSESKCLKVFLRWFRIVSLVLIPTALFSLTFAVSVEYARYLYNLNLDFEKAQYFHDIANKLFLAIDVVGPLANVLSCLFLLAMLLLVYKLRKKAAAESKALKTNQLVTAAHLTITLAFTITQLGF